MFYIQTVVLPLYLSLMLKPTSTGSESFWFWQPKGLSKISARVCIWYRLSKTKEKKTISNHFENKFDKFKLIFTRINWFWKELQEWYNFDLSKPFLISLHQFLLVWTIFEEFEPFLISLSNCLIFSTNFNKFELFSFKFGSTP